MKGLLLHEFTLPTDSKKQVLEKIKKYLLNPKGFFHIVSLNPENIILALQKRKFKKIVKTAQLSIIDGVGIDMAARFLKIKAGERLPGVDLMNNLISLAGEMRLTVLLIGGRKKLAEELANCYSQAYPKARFIGISGIRNIRKPLGTEEQEIARIVRVTKPQMIFVAFGSPEQELWIDTHRRLFSHMVCMGVGGSFDYLSGAIKRPHRIFRAMGLEWFIRLIKQPWRIKRQLRLLVFIYYVVKQKINDVLEIPTR